MYYIVICFTIIKRKHTPTYDIISPKSLSKWYQLDIKNVKKLHITSHYILCSGTHYTFRNISSFLLYLAFYFFTFRKNVYDERRKNIYILSNISKLPDKSNSDHLKKVIKPHLHKINSHFPRFVDHSVLASILRIMIWCLEDIFCFDI